MRFPLGRLLLLVLFALPGLAQPAYRVVVDDAQHGFAAPGESQPLSVTVLDENGGPAANQTVAFVGLEQGPGVDFGGASFVRVTTDAGGVAQASGVVRDAAGPFLVEAVLEGVEGAGATIALTVPASPVQPAVSAAEARAAIASGLVGPQAVLHGPVWLPASTAVFSGGPVSLFDTTQPRAVSSASWLFWIDDQPGAEFAHATRFVLVDAGSADPAADALVLGQRWWPQALAPGETVRSLAPPAFFNLAYTDSVVEPLAAPLRLEAPRPAAPDDACAVILIGPGLRGGRAGAQLFRKHLLDNDLVDAENIADKTTTIGDSTFDRPASRRDFQQMLVSLAGKNCKKFYLYINAHGSEVNSGGGGGIQLAGPDSNPAQLDEVVPYEDIMTMLEPFRSAEVCVLISSCHSGQLISWFDGRGFTGVVAMSASPDKSSLTSRAGPWYVRGFIEAANNPAADNNNDGMITFVEAHAYLAATSRNPSITDPMPHAFTINEGGPRTMTIPNISVYAEGGLERIEIRRPDSAPRNAPFTFTLTVQDAGIGAFNQVTGTIPAEQESTMMSFRGTTCGQTTYAISGQDGAGAAYQATANILVGHFRLSETEIELAPGEEVKITLTRFGYWFERGDMTEIQLSSSDSRVASTQSLLFISGGDETDEFTIRAGAPGDATITVVDGASATRKQIKVKVRAPAPPSTSSCPASGESDVQFAVRLDLGGHSGFIGLLRSRMRFEVDGDQVFIDGDAPQTPPMTGLFNATDCTFTATGNSGSTAIAGYPNVDVQLLNGTLDQLNLKFDYKVGTNGVFPGGQSTTYSATGVFEPDNPVSSGPLTPPFASFPAEGGSGSVFVNFDDGVTWMHSLPNGVGWIEIDGPATRTGPGRLDFTVLPNDSRQELSSGIFVMPEGGFAFEFPIMQEPSLDPNLPLLEFSGNGASFQDGFTSNGWITLGGSNLASATREWAVEDFLASQPLTAEGARQVLPFMPIELEGVSVLVNGRPAYVRFVSPTQLNVLAPQDSTVGEVEIEVRTAAGGSNVVTVAKRPVAPELFRFNPFGGRYAAAVHADGSLAAADGLFQTFTTAPAESGEILLLFGTGFGPTDPPAPPGQIVTGALWLATPVAARVGGLPAQVLFAGLVPGTGLYQVNLVVPELPAGDHLVELFVDGQPLQGNAYLTVAE